MTHSTLLLVKIYLKKKINILIDCHVVAMQPFFLKFFFMVKYMHKIVKHYLIDDQLN